MTRANLLDIRNTNEKADHDIQLKLHWIRLALREDDHPTWRMDDEIVDKWDAPGERLRPNPRRRGPNSHLPKHSSRFRKPRRDGMDNPRSTS